MARLKDEYNDVIVPRMMEKYGYKSKMQIPRVDKIIINVGMGEMANDKDLHDPIRGGLATITGQRPALTRAKKSIANFKIRIGSHVVIPRIRDFRGLPATSFDQQGNYTFGVKEHTIFPEIDLDKTKMVHGMDICIVTTAKTKEEAKELLDCFGMPFVRKE
jgi:large subunit ribosomal protein L5